MTPANTDHLTATQNLLGSFPKMTQMDSISTISNLLSTLREAGLMNVTATDLALRDGVIPWYRPLESYDHSRSSKVLSLSWWYGKLSIGALLAAARLGVCVQCAVV